MTLRTDSRPPRPPLPCQTEDADLWFAERPVELGRAQQLCRRCRIRAQCLDDALRRGEPWGVWGGQIFNQGRIIPSKRGRGRPAKPKLGAPTARADRGEPRVA